MYVCVCVCLYVNTMDICHMFAFLATTKRLVMNERGDKPI